jgi:ATP-dependent Clp protease ATP-binding subunit ClpA
VFERFTDQARRVVVLAQEESRLLGHEHIGSHHLLLGLIREGEGDAAQALTAADVTLDGARRQVEHMVGRGGSQLRSGHIPFTPGAKKALELSLRESLQLGHDDIGTEHVLLGLLHGDDPIVGQVLTGLDTDAAAVERHVAERLATSRRSRSEPVSRGTMLVPGLPLSPGLRAVLNDAVAIAREAGASEVTTDHVSDAAARRRRRPRAEWITMRVRRRVRARAAERDEPPRDPRSEANPAEDASQAEAPEPDEPDQDEG